MPLGRLMERIGGSSYVIYLYHPLFVAAVLFAVGAHVTRARGLSFLVAATAGITGPMLMELVAVHIPGGRLLLEGRTGTDGFGAGKLRVVGEAIPADLRRPSSTSPLP